MSKLLDPFRFLLVAVAGGVKQRQLCVIDYLREENRVLREQLGDERLRFSDDQRPLAIRSNRADDLVLPAVLFLHWLLIPSVTGDIVERQAGL